MEMRALACEKERVAKEVDRLIAEYTILSDEFILQQRANEQFQQEATEFRKQLAEERSSHQRNIEERNANVA